MIKLIPFEAAHMDLFEGKDNEPDGIMSKDAINAMAQAGAVFFTAIDEGRVVCVGGILQISQHTGHCATLVSKHANKCGLRLVRMVKKQTESMMKDMNLHRVETANLITAKEHHKWCKILGFREEGEMPYYDDKGQTYIRFGKYKQKD